MRQKMNKCNFSSHVFVIKKVQRKKMIIRCKQCGYEVEIA